MDRRQFLRTGLGTGAALAFAGCTPRLERLMASTQTGVVTSIDRTNSVVAATLDSGAEITAPYFRDRRRMPWPLCTAVFREDRGQWLCMGPIGARRQVFHDDFTSVTASDYGDTPWNFASTPAGATVSSGTTGALGGIVVTASADPQTCWLAKDDSSLALNGPLHFSARFVVNALVQTYMQISDDKTDITPANGVVLLGDRTIGGDPAVTVTATVGGVSASATGTGDAALDAGWGIWDLILDPGGFVAAWTQGSGPIWVPLPGTGTLAGVTGEPSFFGDVASGTVGDGMLVIDWATLSAVDSVVSPATLGLSSAA